MLQAQLRSSHHSQGDGDTHKQCPRLGKNVPGLVVIHAQGACFCCVQNSDLRRDEKRTRGSLPAPIFTERRAVTQPGPEQPLRSRNTKTRLAKGHTQLLLTFRADPGPDGKAGVSGWGFIGPAGSVITSALTGRPRSHADCYLRSFDPEILEPGSFCVQSDMKRWDSGGTMGLSPNRGNYPKKRRSISRDGSLGRSEALPGHR
ncbi:uncharacterized protein LOC134413281 [Elgaria multicarinata webbii]|uniref:uncharacterized protein LOC134413281 n=1 Tax=Elgaria multicarinata webbii TaxID=159646 RepID=UPI002FCCF8F6